jgi:putative tryptophan/tyrosine transport system substrate-binding protein
VKAFQRTKSILLLIGFIIGSFHLAEAQQRGRIPRIGYVSGTGNASNQGAYVEALRQGLRDLGYVEGKNILIEYRGAEANLNRLPGYIREFVQLKVDIIVAPIRQAILAAKEATATIPIVMITAADPVASGMIESLARPGGNITGIATLSQDLNGKRLELLTDVAPKLSRVAVLWTSADRSTTLINLKEYEDAARALRLQLQSLELQHEDPDIVGAFRKATKERVGALITITSGALFLRQKQIANLAIMNRLPTMFQGSTWVDAGGLMSYSTNEMDAFRRAATYVDNILKGAKPADLPVEQTTRYEMVINLKTANQIGLTIPPNVLARADKVIR